MNVWHSEVRRTTPLACAVLWICRLSVWPGGTHGLCCLFNGCGVTEGSVTYCDLLSRAQERSVGHRADLRRMWSQYAQDLYVLNQKKLDERNKLVRYSVCSNSNTRILLITG